MKSSRFSKWIWAFGLAALPMGALIAQTYSYNGTSGAATYQVVAIAPDSQASITYTSNGTSDTTYVSYAFAEDFVSYMSDMCDAGVWSQE